MATQLESKVLEYKSHIHTHPEVGWMEVLTTRYILEQLQGQSLIDGLGENKTGAVLEVGKGQETIFVRADIDALATSEGPQHLCGHSTHTAALMGAYHWLKDRESALNAAGKRVRFVFQPAEEVHPSGALTLLNAHHELISGAQYGFAVHVEPKLPVGTIQLQHGNTWAANDHIRVEVHGKTAHIKDTPDGIDAIEGAAQVVLLLRAFQKEFRNFGASVVFNFNRFHGGTANNSVADHVLITGGVRWVHQADHARIKDFFDQLPEKMKGLSPATIKTTYVSEVPPACANDAEIVDAVSAYMKQNSAFRVENEGSLSLGVEDFAHYTKVVRALYARVGIACAYDLHHPQMVVSDEATLQVLQYWTHLLQWWIGE